MTNEKEGDYCTICGGIRPDAIKIRTIPVDGKDTGINQLDAAIRAELLRWAGEFNYIPTKKREAYGDALLAEYRKTKE
jgi:hypothetical protein